MTTDQGSGPSEAAPGNGVCKICGGKLPLGFSPKDLCLECTPWPDHIKSSLILVGFGLITLVLAVGFDGMAAEKFDRGAVGLGFHPGAPLSLLSKLLVGLSLIATVVSFGSFKGRVGGLMSVIFGLSMLVGAYWMRGRSVVIAGEEYAGKFMIYLLLAGILVVMAGLEPTFARREPVAVDGAEFGEEGRESSSGS